jgi:hypothetical protein
MPEELRVLLNDSLVLTKGMVSIWMKTKILDLCQLFDHLILIFHENLG